MERHESTVYHHNLVKLAPKAKVLNDPQNKQAYLVNIFRQKTTILISFRPLPILPATLDSPLKCPSTISSLNSKSIFVGSKARCVDLNPHLCLQILYYNNAIAN